MTDDTLQLRPRVRAIGAFAALTARQRLAHDGELDLPDFASLVTIDAFRMALCHPEYVVAMVADFDAHVRSKKGDAFADTVIAAHIAKADAVVRRFPIPMQEVAP
jgi:hypothetical protein